MTDLISWRCLDCPAKGGPYEQGAYEHEQWSAHEVQRAYDSSPSLGEGVPQLDEVPTGAPGSEQPGEGRVLSGIADFWAREGFISSGEVGAVEDSWDFERWSDIREQRVDRIVRDRGGKIQGVDP